MNLHVYYANIFLFHITVISSTSLLNEVLKNITSMFLKFDDFVVCHTVVCFLHNFQISFA